MKLIVMIPCYNEEKTLPLVINSIPKKIPGIDVIETLVIDDGSKDKTIKVAQKYGVTHIIQNKGNKGLAYSFITGLEAALHYGADIIVNTDGDNQYPQEDIPRLIKPILEGKAEIVIADRQTNKIKEFGLLKKLLQKAGSWTVRFISGENIPDAVSGFRAYSRYAALQINIVSDFSYVIETIIQASKQKIPITSIKVKTNPKTRDSRLFNSMWEHIKRSASTTVRVYAMYEPLKVFMYIGFIVFLGGILVIIRFLYLMLFSIGGGHIQSLVVAGVLVLLGFQIMLIGLLADLIATNRKLTEKVIRYLKYERFEKRKSDSQ